MTGLLLVGNYEMGDGDVDHAEVAVKLPVALAVVVAAFVGQRRTRRGETVSTGLALIDMAVATPW